MESRNLEYLTEMSAFELAELQTHLHSTNLEQIAMFMSLLSAYLIVAYLVGSQLTRFQVWAASSIYALFSLIIVIGYFNLFIQLAEVIYYRTGVDVALFGIVATFLILLAWVTSFIFMANVRKQA